MIEISHADASAAILRHVEDGTLVQGRWHGQGEDGREIACLLGAIHPQVKEAADCNGDLMPMWLAELTPTLFDGILAEQIFPLARRYGQLVARWHALSEAQWESVLTRVLIRCIDDAVAAARPVSEGKEYWPQVEAACAQSKTAIESGDAAAGAAAKAAGAASRAAAWAAAWAAGAARAAAWATWAAAWAAGAASRAAAYLSLFNFVLDQIEAECVAAEAAQ